MSHRLRKPGLVSLPHFVIGLVEESCDPVDPVVVSAATPILSCLQDRVARPLTVI